MIVDDHPHLASTLARIIRLLKLPLKITIAHNADEALKLINDQPPDLLIIDYTLPDMNGIELLIQLREKGLKPKHTILITAHAPPEMDKLSRELEIDNYFHKPIDARDLLDTVGGMME